MGIGAPKLAACNNQKCAVAKMIFFNDQTSEVELQRVGKSIRACNLTNRCVYPITNTLNDLDNLLIITLAISRGVSESLRDKAVSGFNFRVWRKSWKLSLLEFKIVNKINSASDEKKDFP